MEAPIGPGPTGISLNNIMDGGGGGDFDGPWPALVGAQKAEVMRLAKSDTAGAEVVTAISSSSRNWTKGRVRLHLGMVQWVCKLRPVGSEAQAVDGAASCLIPFCC